MSKQVFAYIYRTELFEGASVSVNIKSVKLNIFKEDRTYKIAPMSYSIVVNGQPVNVPNIQLLQLTKDHWHIILTTEIDEPNPFTARQIGENELDQAVTTFALISKPEIFGIPVYKGLIFEGNEFFLGGELAFVPSRFLLDKNKLDSELQIIKNNLLGDAEIGERFSLMSRFYTKSLSLKPSDKEEKLIYLWTVLEIYPMKNTTNIHPIKKQLASIIGLDISATDNRLHIGKLYGIRCNLVHNGKLDIKQSDGDVLAKLNNIVYEVLRNMCGLPYSGSLDRFLNQ
jgi:hypothetical protein